MSCRSKAGRNVNYQSNENKERRLPHYFSVCADLQNLDIRTKKQKKKSLSASDSFPLVQNICEICTDTMTNPKELCCAHKFCTECIEASFEVCGPKCPSCGQLFGVMKGNQPNGTMQSVVTDRDLAGYTWYGYIEITYSFRDGQQEVYIY